MIEIPCDIQEVESVSVNPKLGLITMIVLVNNEVVKNTRVKFTALITKWTAMKGDSDGYTENV